MDSGGINNLNTLMKRLEAVTSRIEDAATFWEQNSKAANQLKVEAFRELGDGKVDLNPRQPPALPLPAAIESFDRIIKEEVGDLIKCGAQIGGPVEQQAKAFKRAFEAERTFLLVASKAKQPNPMPPEMTAELEHCIAVVIETQGANRASPLFFHLSAVSEGVLALSWIVQKRPIDFVKDVFAAAQYFGNKVLNEYKHKDTTHVEFIHAYYNIFRSLTIYVREYFAFGLTWNGKDAIDAREALKLLS
ncbi:hypothetical protein Z517_02349 [Fonsecaea pedrosoi CBS 271.37]|uniref:Adenylyl cyclase-associated protein n=1 Tax=Fonsecaea pedrosoi CBS 271.37 TaxID=1442368 RepID=A0A0D2GWW2_9EURO|nr:uncharacterized protein Z517_02349 [Fonsecaea pedrosoi CBS 271.37]KIW83105.1 hypothetical protein Z517_02349 [Fonsecaea pedrosoi CBS 271.37]